MTKGARLGMVLTAQLTWAGEDTDLATFIETGSLGEAAAPVMPFHPELRSQIVKEYEKDYHNGQ